MIIVLTEFINANHRSISRIIPEPIEAIELKKQVVQEQATFGGGCYWGIERLINQKFKGKGLIDTQVGFMSPFEESNKDLPPTYEELSSGDLGHIEVIQIQYDSNKVTYEELTRYFFTIHDPTEFGR